MTNSQRIIAIVPLAIVVIICVVVSFVFAGIVPGLIVSLVGLLTIAGVSSALEDIK